MDGNQPKQTLLQRFWSRVHDNRGAVVALVLAAGVVGLAQLTHALGSLGDFFWPNPAGEKAEYCDLLTPLIVQLDRTGTASSVGPTRTCRSSRRSYEKGTTKRAVS